MKMKELTDFLILSVLFILKSIFAETDLFKNSFRLYR